MKDNIPHFMERDGDSYVCPSCHARRPRMKQIDDYLLWKVWMYGSPIIAVAILVICVLMTEYTNKLIQK
jgi:hypothetical protein